MTPADLAMVRAIVAKLWHTSLCHGMPHHHQDEAVSRTLLAIVEAGRVEHLSTFAYVIARQRIMAIREEEMRAGRVARQMAVVLGQAIPLHDDAGHVDEERRAPFSVDEVVRAMVAANGNTAAAAEALGITPQHVRKLIRDLQIDGIPRKPRGRPRKRAA